MEDKPLILVVDDNADTRMLVSMILNKTGFSCATAENGVAALARLKEGLPPDLIISDIMMPEMDGYATMREIRQQREFAKLPIIALTAKAMRGDRNKCVEAGANDYLPKPIDSEKLLSLLRVWLYR